MALRSSDRSTGTIPTTNAAGPGSPVDTNKVLNTRDAGTPMASAASIP